MANVHQYRIDWTDENGTTTQLTDALSWDVRQAVGVRSDTFRVRLHERAENQNAAQFYPNFKLQNQVKIYASSTGSLNTASDLLIDGEILEMSKDFNEGGYIISLIGANRTGRLLSKQRPANLTSAGLTTSIFSTFIQSVNDDLNELGKDNITWAADNATNSSTISEYHTNYKPIIDHIETLSSDEYTGDGDKIFWVDESNKFHWKDRPTVISGNLVEGENIQSFDATLNSDDVINFAIINAGKDDDGNSVTTYVHSAASIASLGFRSEFILDEEIANQTRKDTGLSGSNLRDAIKTAAREKWRSKLLGPKWKCVIELEGTHDFTRGNKYRVTAPTMGVPFDTGKALTAENVRHSFTNEGWITVLDLKEEDADVDTSLNIEGG